MGRDPLGAAVAPRKVPKTDRSRQRRQSLLDALDRLLGQIPFRGITPIDVSREAYTSPPTFYQYFTSLDDALYTLAEGTVAAFEGAFSEEFSDADGDLEAQVLDRVYRFFALCATNRPQLVALGCYAAQGDEQALAVLDRVVDPLVRSLAGLASLENAYSPSQVRTAVRLLLVVALSREVFGADPETAQYAVAHSLARTVHGLRSASSGG